MPRAVLGGILLALLPMAAFADDAQELGEHLGKVVGAFEATALYQQQCDSRDPEGVVARKDAMAAWSHDNSRADYERAMAGLHAEFPDLEAQFAPQRENLAREIAADIDRSPEQCEDFAGLLEDEQFDVSFHVRRLLSLSAGLGIDIPEAEAITPAVRSPDEVEIVPLSTLSARLKAKMAEIGSDGGAAESRSLREAREEHAEAWLEADGVQVLFGRVTAEDELREWRGDLQSAFKAECRTFSEDAYEERMAASIGQDMVLVGAPRLVIDSPTEGRVTLDRCSLFTVEEVGRPLAKADDSAGLVLRPLEFDEAYAGPGQGIALNQVDRVLYASSFDNRLDGFGNGYIDRREDIYVLLRDGSAYRHEWSFPFTDLDVERSRQREPGRWYRWNEQGGAVTLTDDDGEEAVDLADAQRLRPFPAQTFAADYYYLQIGMGGARQDRRYVFSDDGTVLYTRGGFVAGNVGTSYIIVNGPDDPEVRAKYRFEDYVLILETEAGEERHFLAMAETDDLPLPGTLLIDGTAYWLDGD